jgi:LEA14-like dessication related protein
MRIPPQFAKLIGILFLFCSLPLLNGCAKMYGFKEEPRISVADIRIQEVKALEGIFLITLRVQNPNDVPLDIHGINCDLEINSRHFASGVGDSSQTVPAFGAALATVTVYASVLDIVASVADLLHTAGRLSSKDTAVPYTLQGTVRIGVHGFKKDVPFNSSGELSLKGLSLPR